MLRHLLPCIGVACSLFALTDARPYTKKDVHFLSLPTKLAKDHSGRGGDPADKYFHESTFHPHYDGRFADHEIPDSQRLPELSNLVQSYLSTMQDIGVETWIQHGTLLGWWWNRKILPWDSDLDLQVDEASMTFLANYYNMTIHNFKPPKSDESSEYEDEYEVEDDEEEDEGRAYMLEINPHYSNPSPNDRLNMIDARWVDTITGLFIDVTAVRKNDSAPEPGTLSCKDGHHYRDSDIFPLRESIFEGQVVKIPYAYSEILLEEYGEKALTRTSFNGHKWNQETLIWEPFQPNRKFAPPSPGTARLETPRK